MRIGSGGSRPGETPAAADARHRITHGDLDKLAHAQERSDPEPGSAYAEDGASGEHTDVAHGRRKAWVGDVSELSVCVFAQSAFGDGVVVYDTPERSGDRGFDHIRDGSFGIGRGV